MRFKKVIPWSLFFLGSCLIVGSIFPILSYEWQADVRYPNLLSPTSFEESERYRFKEKDYNNTESWFDYSGASGKSNYRSDYYTISIPKLKINSAIVKISGSDLSQSLVQFSGSALPGERGNTVIFGHSVLPVFFNSNNYISIFSTLYKLKHGDEILVSFEDTVYRYVVESAFEVRPSDIEVLQQNSSVPYLSLITCSPPNTTR